MRVALLLISCFLAVLAAGPISGLSANRRLMIRGGLGDGGMPW
jgi:hypothetical protein